MSGSDAREPNAEATLVAHWLARGLPLEDVTLDAAGALVLPPHTVAPTLASAAPAAPPAASLTTLSSDALSETGARDPAHLEAPSSYEPDGMKVSLGAVLGFGGMGVVHAAEQRSLHRTVAVKSLRPEDTTPVSIAALLREAWITASIEHPSVVPIHSLCGDEGAPQLVMKRIDGQAWSESLYTRGESPAKLARDLDRHLSTLLQVCQVVSAAHARGIVHLDIKPSNVMLGEFGAVYLIDWGIAACFLPDAPAWMPRTRDICLPLGTPAYMAPEQAAANAARIGPRTDVYLLGGILHTIVTGHPPHTGQTPLAALAMAYDARPPALGPDIPDELARIVTRSLSSAPEDRYPSAEALRQAIDAFLQHRASMHLTTQAHERLERIVASPTTSEGPSVELSRLVDECRFGFQQALLGWPENESARQGQQRLFRHLATRAVERGDWKEATTYASELPTPDAELSTRIAAARDAEAKEAARIAELKRIAHDTSLTFQAPVRATLAARTGIAWFVWNIGCGWLDKSETLPISHGVMLAATVTASALYGLAVYSVRNTLLGNAINRRLLGLYAWSFPVGAVLWAGAWLSGVPLRQAVALSGPLYLLFLGAIATLMDRRARWVPLFVSPIALLSAAFPDWAFEGIGLLGLVSGALLYALWRNDAAKDAASTSEPND